MLYNYISERAERIKSKTSAVILSNDVNPLTATLPAKLNLALLTQFPDLTSFLLARASRSTQLANYFYWYLSVECTEGKDKLKYERIRLKFLEGLKCVSCNCNWGGGQLCPILSM